MSNEKRKCLLVSQLEALLAKAQSQHDTEVQLFGHATPGVIAEIARLKFILNSHSTDSPYQEEEIALTQLKALFRDTVRQAEAEEEANGQASDRTNAEIQRLHRNVRIKGFELDLKKAGAMKEEEETLYGTAKPATTTLIARIEHELEKLQQSES